MAKFLFPGKRTPFVTARTSYAGFSALQLSVPIVEAMTEAAQPDFLLWGQVVADPATSNIGRQLVLASQLSPQISAATSTMTCSTGMLNVIQGASMIGSGGWHLGLIGGAEAVSQLPVSLKTPFAQKVAQSVLAGDGSSWDVLQGLEPSAYNLSFDRWTSGGLGTVIVEQAEMVAQRFDISNIAQRYFGARSHEKARLGFESGFFEDLVTPFAGVSIDSQLQHFARTGKALQTGKLPNTEAPLCDGAAGIWVADEEGAKRMERTPRVELLDWQICSVESQTGGRLLAAVRAILTLLMRHDMSYSDISFWEIHEAYAAMMIAKANALSDPGFCNDAVPGCKVMGVFPEDRLNPYGGSLAIGHPYGATGARLLSQAVKNLEAYPVGSLAMTSISTGQGQSVVVLLRRV